MPWTAESIRKHKHDLTDAEAEKAARIANSVLERTGDEGRALRSAFAVIDKNRRKGRR